MSSERYDERRDPSVTPDSTERKPVEWYQNRLPEGYIHWIRDYLGVELTEAQKHIIRTIHRNQRTLIVGANGFGKSYCLVAFSLAFLFINFPTSILTTSGTYSKLRRTYCKPLQNLHENNWGLPGKYLKYPPRIVIDGFPEVFLEVSSPRDAGELEGVHNEHTLGVIEEADKDAVDASVFDSMESLMTDERDRVVAVANPPKDETNLVHSIMEDPSWTQLNFSSFESHNVDVEVDHPDPYIRDEEGTIETREDGTKKLKPEVQDEMVDGLVRLSQIRQDWESWNGLEWPGLEDAMNSDERDDLDQRWYIRRLGMMPPVSAEVHRPFDLDMVNDAFRATPTDATDVPVGLGLDVARGEGDYNCLCACYGTEVKVLRKWHGTDHIENEEVVRDALDSSWRAPIAVDSVGVGDGLSDRISTFYPSRIRFNAGANAADESRFDDMWTEGMWWMGEFLENGAYGHSDYGTDLREQLLAAARTLEFEEVYRGSAGTTRLKLNSKTNVKARLPHVDVMDAAYQSVWAANADFSTEEDRTIPSTW